MRSLLLSAVLLAWAAGAWAAGAAAADSAAADAPASPRIEARSNDLLAVGLVHGDEMSIHISRLADNAPVRDAVVTVVLRGIAHATTAEADGSYALRTKDLALPGAAAVDFLVAQGAAKESLKGTLDLGSVSGQSDNKNSSRQMWWWVLNFAVCGAAVWLFSRRKAAKD